MTERIHATAVMTDWIAAAAVETRLDLLCARLWSAPIAAQDLERKVLAASFKNVERVHELIAAGIQSVTVPLEVVKLMIEHPGTEIAVGEFTENWNKAYDRKTFRA